MCVVSECLCCVPQRHPKMDLNKTDLLRLLSYLEGELQARDISIAALKVRLSTYSSHTRLTLKSCSLVPPKHLHRCSQGEALNLLFSHKTHTEIMFTCPTKTTLVLPENYKCIELLWHDVTHLDIYNIQDDVSNEYVLVHFLNVEGKM